jgi:hypothetical protein
MNRAINLRLKKLEAQRKAKTGQIPVWCDDEADVSVTISEMIALGEISEADRPRCIHWQRITECAPGTHEWSLEHLD